jgi:hypothetical protein
MYYLKKRAVAFCDKMVINVINTVGHYLALFL